MKSTWSSSILAWVPYKFHQSLGFLLEEALMQSYTQKSPGLRWSVWTLASCTGSGLSFAIVLGPFLDGFLIRGGGKWIENWTHCWKSFFFFLIPSWKWGKQRNVGILDYEIALICLRTDAFTLLFLALWRKEGIRHNSLGSSWSFLDRHTHKCNADSFLRPEAGKAVNN